MLTDEHNYLTVVVVYYHLFDILHHLFDRFYIEMVTVAHRLKKSVSTKHALFQLENRGYR